MNDYFNLILTERQWSWALVGILYLVITLLIRLFVFRVIAGETRALDGSVYSSVRTLYQKNSIGGWVLFATSFLLVVTVWIGSQKAIPQSLLLLVCFILPVLFLFSIILHILAFTKAMLAIFRQRMGVEKEF